MFTIYNKIKSKLGKYTWDLAILDYSEDILNRSLKELHPKIVQNPYKTKWFADPFILDVDEDNVLLLVEEFDKNVGRGRIAEIKIDKVLNKIVDCSIILDLPTHLSFPAIYRVNGEIYVHPENYHSGKSVMYKYDSSMKQLIPHKILLEEPIADAVIHKFGEDYYMFATVAPDFNGSKLQVYKSKDFDAKYERCDTLEFESNIARMAGDFMPFKDKLIRPAQDCNGAYGKRVVFQEISIDVGFSFKTIGELSPYRKYVGLHTFNSFVDKIIVIDLKRYCHPVLHKLFNKIKR